MVFSSVNFLFFFLPIFIIFYYCLPTKLRNIYILLASYTFYAWGAYEFLGLLIISTFVDYLLGIAVDKSQGRNRKLFTLCSIVFNLGILAYFKYMNFFVEQFNKVLSEFGMTGVHWTQIALPVGISFFTFHKISYIVDVYRGKEKALRSYIDFSLYIALFPQLVAGPIIRFNEISSQFKNRIHSFDKFFEGIWRFTIGLGKKVILANSAGQVSDQVFELSGSDLSMPLAWVGVVCYALQIYFDFSGYSDMAIGLGKMMGFDIPENFYMPYISKNITEFWRRWHMSLSRFFRDYVYIPLGGNRHGSFKTNRNLWVVFFLTGFWHGASWNFIVWGLFHGFFLTIEKRFTVLAKPKYFWNMILTFIIVLIGWVFFRAEDLPKAVFYLSKMIDPTALTFNPSTIPSLSLKTGPIIVVALFFSFIPIRSKILELSAIRATIVLLILGYCTLSLSSASYNPFIYFRF